MPCLKKMNHSLGKLLSLTGTGNEYTSKNVDTLSSSSTNESEFKDDIIQADCLESMVEKAGY